jgi:hypothetical protein
MNTANLQLAGVLAALGTVLDLLRAKGLVTETEIEAALAGAEETLRADRRPTEVSKSNVDAMCFPIRYLRASNASKQPRAAAHYAEITTAVGQMKQT